MTFLFGYAQSDLTPTLNEPVYLAGFGRNRRALGVHDRLTACTMVLQLDTRLVAVVALDLIGLVRSEVVEIEGQLQRAFPGIEVLIACTNTQHGPDTIGFWGPDEATRGADDAYLDFARRSVIATVRAAIGVQRPAMLRSASIDVPGLVRNDRDPEIVDPELSCMQFVNPETHSPLATWLIFPCRPEALWYDNVQITADYCHALRRAVGITTGAPCVCMAGAAGGPITPDMPQHTFDVAAVIGDLLAYAAQQALALAVPRSVTSLSFSAHEFTIPLQNPFFQAAMNAGVRVPFAMHDNEVLTRVSLLCINDTWVFNMPGEVFPALGLRYKEMLRQAGADLAAVVGIADDSVGVILPAEDFTAPADYFEPHDAEEEGMSVGPEAAPRLTAVLEEVLHNTTTRHGVHRL